MFKLKFYLFLLQVFLLSNNIYAQLSINFSTTTSSCSSNGIISINNIGGNIPITYEILSGPPGFSRPSQTINVFTSIPPGNYTIQATDAKGQVANATTTVNGSYTPLQIKNCVVSGSRITVNALNGLPPYSYSISSDGGNNFSPPQTSNIFDCLPEGDYVLRALDACNNFFPCQGKITILPPTSRFTCTPVSPGVTNIKVTSTTGGEAPFNYTLENNSGQIINNSTGIFTNVPGCSYKLTVTDKCGKNTLYTDITCIKTDVQIGINCINFNNRTASVFATGGVPPYIYFETRTNTSNNTGNFTNLLNLVGAAGYTLKAKDACANESRITIFRPSINAQFEGCPYDSTIFFTKDTPLFISDSCGTPNSKCEYTFYPVTISCPTCPPSQQVKIINRPSRFDPFPLNEAILTGIAPGNYNITVSDACGNSSLKTIRPKVTAINVIANTSSFCANRIIRIRKTDNKAYESGTLVTLFDSKGAQIGQNATGNFTLNKAGTYQARVDAPNCATTTIPIDVSYSLQSNLYCDSISFTPCPDISGYSYQLVNPNTAAILQSSTNRWFTGLSSGNNYRIIATNPVLLDSIVFNFKAGTLPPKYVADSITCSSFLIIPDPADFQWQASGNVPPRYLVFDQVGNQVANQLSNRIQNLGTGTYTFRVEHPICGVRTGTVNLPSISSQSFCLKPSDNFASTGNNNTCSFGWDVTYNSGTSQIRVTGGPNNINKLFNGNGTYQINGLAPGSYNIQTECGSQSLNLPASPLSIKAQATSTCPGQGRINSTGALSIAEWTKYLNTNSATHCGEGLNIVYRLKSFNGNTITENTTGQFENLQQGLTYKVELYSANCRLDSTDITIPFYVRPQLSATFGAICGSPAVGAVQLSVNGGSPPFKYEILSPSGISPIYSSNRTVQFNNLIADNYIYRVSDSCGVSSDFSSGVDFFNFKPRFKRLCNGGIQLDAPFIIGATYTWSNSAGQIVGKIPNPLVADNGADKYSLKIQLASCTYNQSVSVPLQTNPIVFANGGPDIVDTTFKTQLLGVNPNNSNLNTYWFQTSPSSGSTIFNNYTDPKTNIWVSEYPGQYTYVWTVDGGDNGCVDYDTVTVILVECSKGISDITANLNISPTSCTAADGTAKVLVTSPSTVFSYFWSNGGRADNISGLLPGKYTIKVTDGDYCTRDFFKEFDITSKISLRTDTIVDICKGERFRVGNNYYDSTGNYVDSLKSIFLCDSVIYTQLIVHPIEYITLDTAICIGQSINFNGKLLSVQGTYLDTLTSVYGCDSIVTVNLTVNPIKTTSIIDTICSDGFYLFAGNSLNIGGIYTDSLLSYLGCDSVVTLKLTVNPVRTTNLIDFVCEGKTYDFNGRDVFLQDIYYDTLRTINNCDSIIILDLKVLALSTAPLDVAICDGQSFTFNGKSYGSTGIYIDTLVNALNCDSIVTLNLTVNPKVETIINAVICSDGFYNFNGLQLNKTGIYTELLSTYLNCDSLVTLNLNVFDVLLTTVNEEICAGDKYLFNGIYYNQTGTYIDTLITADDCDSIVSLNLLVKPIKFTQLDISICENESYNFNGTIFTQTGNFIDTITGFNGCDSIITLNLQVNPIRETILNEQICDGDIFDFIGDPLTKGGTYTKVLSTYLNCDSTVILNLVVNPVQNTNIIATICNNETYNFNGKQLNTSGLYTDSLRTFLNCDSLVNLNLTVLPISSISIFKEICEGESYDFNSRLLNLSGTYIDTLRTFQDCDSIITLILLVKPISFFSFKVSICNGESYDFNGTVLNQSGTYTQILPNYHNCDSTITLTLQVNPVKDTLLNRAICDGEDYNFIGDLLDAPGIYIKKLSTYLGCDSIVRLNLSVNTTQITPIAQTICSNEQFDFNGFILNQTGQYIDTLSTYLGCDSIVILNLTANPIQTKNINATICEGKQYNFNGVQLAKAGIYRDTLRTYQNCDSIVILSLDINPRSYFDFTSVICDGENFNFNGQLLSKSGNYVDTIRNFQNCDSVITLTLIVNPVQSTYLRDTICEGDSYIFIGQALTLPDDYIRVLKTFQNCDSTVHLNLTVLQRSYTTIDVEICEGTSFDFNGTLYSAQGTYFDTLSNYFNCDSIITLNLNILPRERVTIQGQVCDNDFYNFNGKNYNQSGTYIDTLPNIKGCDSIITLQLIVNPTYNLAITDSLCTGDIYFFGGKDITTGGVYNEVLTSNFGCDSIVALTLLQRDIPKVDLGLDTFLCGKSPIILNLPLESGTIVTWQDGKNNNPYYITTKGNYSVKVSNICGIDEDEILVNAGCDGCDVYFPNAFTPNNDGVNDRFRPQFGCEPIAISDFWVADRWGNVIYQAANDLTAAWDGTYQGKPSPSDNYVWFISISFELNGTIRKKSMSGGVLLLR